MHEQQCMQKKHSNTEMTQRSKKATNMYRRTLEQQTYYTMPELVGLSPA